MVRKRIKVADIPNITERGHPFIVHTWSTSDKAVLHISHRDGVVPKKTEYGLDIRYRITECNRPLSHSMIYVEKDILLALGFKLCSRCGDAGDFQVALIKYQEFRRKLDKKRAEREWQKRIERETAATDRGQRLTELYTWLRSIGLNVSLVGNPAHSILFKRKDHTFAITEMDEDAIQIARRLKAAKIDLD